MQAEAVVFDVGRVLYQWHLRHLFEKLVTDPARLDMLLGEVVTEEWHFEHDRGRTLGEMVPERIALYPDFEPEIRAYAARFNETIPGPVPGSHALVERLDARGVPLYAITNFGAEFWAGFRPTAPIFDRFRAIVVSGEEKLAKPDPAIFDLAARRFGRAPEAYAVHRRQPRQCGCRRGPWLAGAPLQPGGSARSGPGRTRTDIKKAPANGSPGP